MASRDLDSRVNSREAAAVKEWLNSEDKAFHFMRDHPAHGIEILGRYNWLNKSLYKFVEEILQKHF